MKNFKSIGNTLRPFFKGLPFVILLMIAAVVVAKRYLKYVTPLYESSAKIKLADTHEGVGNSNLYKDLDVFVTSNKVTAEVELMKSKVIVQKAVNKLDLHSIIYRVGDIHKTELYTQSPFILKAALSDCKWADKPFALAIYSDSLFHLTLPDGEKVDGALNQMINTKCGPIFIILNKALLMQKPYLKLNDNYEFKVFSDQNIVDEVAGNLDVMSVDRDVPVLRISYKSPVAEKSADIVNAISAAYISDYIDEKYRSADTAAIFLDRQLKEFNNRLTANENAVEDYREANNIINIHQETETNLRKIADLQKVLASVKMNLVAADTLNDYIQRGKGNMLELAPNFEAFNDLLSTEMVKSVKQLQREKKELLIRFTPEDEKVKAIDEKLKDLTGYMIESIKNTKINLEAKYKTLSDEIKDAETSFIGLPGKEKKMAILDRNFTLNEQIYRFLHEKRAEAEIAKAATISFHRVISAAEVPRGPVSPNPSLILALAVFLSFLAGLAIIYGWHAARGRVSNPETIYKNTALPLAQIIPYFKTAVLQQKFFRKWALQLEIKGLLQGGAMIAVSSFDKKEGKQFITANLARSVQRLGKKVLLVDAEGGMATKPGIAYYNLRQHRDHYWHKPAVWQQLVEKWRMEYDVVLLKNFALQTEPNALLLMSDVQLNLMVLDSLLTRKTRIDDTELLQQEVRLLNMEFVLNRAGHMPGLFTLVKEFIIKRVNPPKGWTFIIGKTNQTKA